MKERGGINYDTAVRSPLFCDWEKLKALKMETETEVDSSWHLLQKLPTASVSGPLPQRTHYNRDCPRIHKAQMKNPISKINNLDQDFIHPEMITKEFLGKWR